MKRRAATLLGLGGMIVLLALAGGLVAWHPWSRADRDGEPQGEPRATFVTILALPQEDLRSIELISASGDLELRQEGGSWRMVKPAPSAVNAGPMKDLLYSLANLASERVIATGPKDLTPYGLERPAVTVRATTAGGEVRELHLGDMTPAGDSYYLMAKGDPRVFTVREHHGTYFHYGVRELRPVTGRTPVDGSNVVALSILRRGARLLEIARTMDLYRDDVEFRGTTLSVVYPWEAAPKPVDLTSLTGFVTTLGALQAEVPVDASPRELAAYGLDRPAYELRLEDGAGNRLHVAVGNPRGQEVYLRFEGDPTIYAGDPRLLEFLDVDPFRFVSRYAAIVKLADVDKLTISSGAVTHDLEIRRKARGSEEGARWLVDGRDVAMQRFKDFYTFAISLQIDSFQDNQIGGTPEVTMVFALNTPPAATYAVRFLPYNQEFYAVTKNGKGDILVNRQQVKVLLQKLAALAAGK